MEEAKTHEEIERMIEEAKAEGPSYWRLAHSTRKGVGG